MKASEKREEIQKSRSEEETKAFYQDSLGSIRAGKLDESTGKLIAERIEIKPTKSLIMCARRWLVLFPEHSDAPELVGQWLLAARLNMLLSTRLEQEPASRLWARIFPPMGVQGKAIDKLIVQWLKLNRDNPDKFVSAPLAFTSLLGANISQHKSIMLTDVFKR